MFQNSVICPKCDDQGWIPIDNQYAKRCDCYIEKLLRKTIPKRFDLCSLENYKPKDKLQTQAKKAIQEKPAGSFFLHGSWGRGKTHLLFAQYRTLVTAGRRCFVRTTKEMLNELTGAELDKSPSSLLEALEAPTQLHLFWDDADKLKPTEFKYEVLFNLIDTIYRHEHGLTVTSNLDLTKLQDVLTPAMVRRIDDICQVIDLGGG